jgi:hypothetical protein
MCSKYSEVHVHVQLSNSLVFELTPRATTADTTGSHCYLIQLLATTDTCQSHCESEGISYMYKAVFTLCSKSYYHLHVHVPKHRSVLHHNEYIPTATEITGVESKVQLHVHVGTCLCTCLCTCVTETDICLHSI